MKRFQVFRASRATRQQHFKTSSTGHENVTLIKWVKRTLTLQLVPLLIYLPKIRGGGGRSPTPLLDPLQ